MKLGELKSAIRAHKGNPTVVTSAPNGVEFRVKVQKASLLEELDRLFESKASETGFSLTDDGDLVGPDEARAINTAAECAVPVDLDLDLDTPAEIDLGDL